MHRAGTIRRSFVRKSCPSGVLQGAASLTSQKPPTSHLRRSVPAGTKATSLSALGTTGAMGARRPALGATRKSTPPGSSTAERTGAAEGSSACAVQSGPRKGQVAVTEYLDAVVSDKENKCLNKGMTLWGGDLVHPVGRNSPLAKSQQRLGIRHRHMRSRIAERVFCSTRYKTLIIQEAHCNLRMSMQVHAMMIKRRHSLHKTLPSRGN
jgi:hypothetical protein